MSKQRDEFVAAKIAEMSLLEKCDQLLTFTWRGAHLTPSRIAQITKLEVGYLCCKIQSPNAIFQFRFGMV